MRLSVDSTNIETYWSIDMHSSRAAGTREDEFDAD
jgi:hypothetical protein